MLEQFNRGLVRFQSRQSFLFVGRSIALDPKFPDDEWQREPLKDQGGENHGERQEQNVIPAGKWAAVSQNEWQCERSRERDDTAHARPRDDGNVLPCWERI